MQIKTYLIPAIFSFLSLVSFLVLGQSVPPKLEGQEKNYKQALKLAEEENKYASAAGICGKLGYFYWNNQMYEEASTYFEKSIFFNEKINNKNGIKSVLFQLGLVKIDQEDYAGALTHFEKGVDISRTLNSKEDILSGLINVASIQQSLSKHQAAIEASTEALELSKELDIISLTKRCYGILYESYQSLGNSEKSIEYFELYSTIDKYLKNEQIKKITTESNERVVAISTAKKQSDAMLALSQLELIRAQDSLRLAREIGERQRLQLKLNELTLSEQKAQLENEKLIRNNLIIIVSLVMVFMVILYILYRQKKKQNILLEKQKRKIEKQGDILSTKNDELLAVNKEKNLMMSMVAHDLKKPINDLTSLAMILDDYKDKLPDDFNKLVAVLQQSSHGYRDMVHKILDAGAIENRKLNIVEEKLSIGDIFEKNANSQKLASDKKNIKINTSDIPKEAFVKADPIYLAQAIENVLVNSIKYSPEDSTIYMGAIQENGHYQMYVRDEGPGIGQEEQKYLFESFKILKNGDKESTGLGLSISKKYIEEMGGEIYCESEPDKGTTFYFRIESWL